MSRPIRRIAVLGAAAFVAALLAFPAVSGAATTCKLSLSAARTTFAELRATPWLERCDRARAPQLEPA